MLPGIVRNRDQYGAFDRILFRDDSVPMIEKVESPRQIKGVLGQKCWLSTDGRLSIRIFQTRSPEEVWEVFQSYWTSTRVLVA